MEHHSKTKDLTEYLALLEEAKRRDHRKLGKELELFVFSKVGQGLPLWLPKGAALRERLEQFLKKSTKKAVTQVVTPHIGQKELYVTSGHYINMEQIVFNKYIRRRRVFIETNELSSTVNLQCTTMVYKDLPKRYAEFGTIPIRAKWRTSRLTRVRIYSR
jgi:threonyl-tRNA synthetase